MGMPTAIAGTLGLPRGRSHAREDGRTGRPPRHLRLLRTHGRESPPCHRPLPEPRRARTAPRRAGPCPGPGQGPAGVTTRLSARGTSGDGPLGEQSLPRLVGGPYQRGGTPGLGRPGRALQWQVCGRCREASHDFSQRRLHAVRLEGALRGRHHDVLGGPALRPDRPERRRQVHVHEAADRRAAAAEGHGRRGRRKLGVLRQDQFAFDEFRVIDTVIMGNERLWTALEERERALREARHDRRGRHAPRRARGHRRRRGRLHRGERRRDPAAGPRHPRRAARADDGASCRAARRCACCWRRRSSASPQALLLDEPTNHLDLDSIHWLRGVPRALRGHADRHLARPALPERGLHAHRRHRLPDDHHLHRRLRRHGAGQDADPRADRGRERAAREEDRAAQRLHRALRRRHAREPGDVAPQGSRAAADDRARAVEHPAPVHQVRDRSGRRARLALECKGVSQGVRRRWRSSRDFSAVVNRGEKIVLVGRNGVGKTTLLKALLADAPGVDRRSRGDRRRRHGALGARGVGRLLPAGPHRRDRRRD